MPCRTRIGATAFRSAAWRAFNPDEGGVVSAGGVGFDISCGVRCLHTGLKTHLDIVRAQKGVGRDALLPHSRGVSAAPARSISMPARWSHAHRGRENGRSSAAGVRMRTLSASKNADR